MKFSLLRLLNINIILLIAIGMMLLNPLPLSATIKRQLLGLSGVASLSSTNIANGQVALLEIDLRNLDLATADLTARFRQNGIALFQHPIKSGGIYCGLIAIPLSAKPEASVVELQWTDADGRQAASIPFRIIDGKYKSEALKVDARHVTLSKKDLQRVRGEKKEIRRIYASSSVTRLWYGGFKRPLAGETTSSFGTERLFNGQHQSYHRGADFRAKAGTPVYASNSGIVKLAKNLFYSGNIVIVDHGMGTFTNYAHLSKIEVQAGQHIEKGHQIGRVGATGRVSGPHLHWAVKVNGVYVDPLRFVRVISDLLGQ
jgi:murein DD-endopeptidase MepM/ murein hydrolase activator NlpD